MLIVVEVFGDCNGLRKWLIFLERQILKWIAFLLWVIFRVGLVPLICTWFGRSVFPLRPSKLRNDQTQTHTKKERAKQIMKCSIIGTQRTHLKRSSSSYSLCFWKWLLFFFPQVLIESAIKLKPCIIQLYTESLQALTDRYPLLNFSQSVYVPTSQHVICLNLYHSPFVSASVLLNNE